MCVCLYVHKHTSVGMYAPLCMWRRENIFQELILPSHCVGPVDMSKGLATASLKPLKHLSDPLAFLFNSFKHLS